MTIESNEGVVGGKPCIEGHRIWVSHVVECIERLRSVERFLEWYPQLTRDQVREALDYCRKEQCIGNVIAYCQNCTKDKRPPIRDDPGKGVHILGDVSLDNIVREWNPQGKFLIQGTEDSINRRRDLWKLAGQLYEENFCEE